MIKKYKKILSVICCFVFVIGSTISLAACSEKEKTSYDIVYDLNYEGETNRIVNIPSGAAVIDWQPSRPGYELVGWYTDPNFTRKYDFNKKAGANLTLYAKWKKAENSAVITFDANFRGKSKNTVATVSIGDFIYESFVPQINRLGYEFTGWYEDAECTVAWDFNKKVSEDTTLYAGYKRDNSVKRDADGNPVFDNITVNVWISWTGIRNDNVLWSLAKAFNNDARYKGKIRINATSDLTSQDLYSARFQKTIGKNETDDMYYSVDEVFGLANIDYAESDWYENANRESYVEGKMGSVPIAASVPYLLYNKRLMAKYNGENALPSTYSEFSTLLQKAYRGERTNNEEFRSIITCKDGAYSDTTSYAAFLQNSADYYSYENGKYINKWNDSEDNFNSAVTALTNTYNMFGAGGDNYGMLCSRYDDETVSRQIINGNALVGIINEPQTILDLYNRKDIGVLPLSGLFADDGEQKNQIPVQTIGLAFYKAANVTNTELAAAGVFADYVSKNSYLFAQNGWYPLNKSVVESDKFQNSDNGIVTYLRQIGDPSNFRTLDGHTNGSFFLGNIASKQYVIPMLQGNGDNIADCVEKIATSMNNM